MLLPCLAPPVLAAPAEQTLVFEVAVPGDRVIASMLARVTRAGGETVLVNLTDDLGERAGSPFDGIWSGTLAGVPERYAQVVLEVTPALEGGAPAAVAFSGVVRTEDLPVAVVGFRVAPPPDELIARRAVFALPGHAAEEQSAQPVWAAFGWLWAAVFWVGAMVARSEAAKRSAE